VKQTTVRTFGQNDVFFSDLQSACTAASKGSQLYVLFIMHTVSFL